MANTPLVTFVSECFIKPKTVLEKSKKRYRLTPWELPYLSRHYNQQGLLYANPEADHLDIERLKDSFAAALVHFYPLAGQLVTELDPENPSKYCYTFIDCSKGPGARFIHAVSKKLSVSDVQTPRFNRETIHSLYQHNGALNNDAHSKPMMTVQVTELQDGVFISFSINHVVIDGVSYWHFINTWSNIYANEFDSFSPRPIYSQRWEMFPEPIKMPILRPNEFVADQQNLVMREFRFSKECLAKIKARANAEYSKTTNDQKLEKKISSLQALSALLWRATIRARRIQNQQEPTLCELAANNRARLKPPFSPYYFGNCEQDVFARTTVKQVIHDFNLGQVAALLNKAVTDRDRDPAEARKFVDEWVKSPYFYPPNPVGKNGVSIASSPRFNMYGNEFGMGRPVGIRDGYGNMFDGKMHANEGFEGVGSVDLEVCLDAKSMDALESDQEFMAALT